VDMITLSRMQRSRHGVRRTFSASAGRRTHYRYLSIRIPVPVSEGDSLADAIVCLGPSPGEQGSDPAGILIKFPAEWDEKAGRALAKKTQRPLSLYHAREPLVLDFVTLLLRPGHSHIFLESAAAALVCSVLEAEEAIVSQRLRNARLPR
jgi:hypothetical protein